MDCSMAGFLVLHYLLEFAHTHVYWVCDAIQPSYPLWSFSLPAFNLPQPRGLFQWVSSLQQAAKILELQLQHQSFQWTFRISFRINWFYLLGVQGTLKSLLQYHSWKASVLWCSAFCMAQLSYLYITMGKTIALTVWNFVGKVMVSAF